MLADSNIELVIGHHAHVVQPMQEIDGKWIAYGRGAWAMRAGQPEGGRVADAVHVHADGKRVADRGGVRAAVDDG
ncbi:hypothetical protein GCM10010530_46690 [Kribbella aluminosa]